MEPNLDGIVALLTENESLSPVKLRKGAFAGKYVRLSQEEKTHTKETTVPAVAAVTKTDVNPALETNRTERLMKVVDLEWTELTPEQLEQIKALISEYSDLFALEPVELGTTDVVTHSIDTGEQQPICQPPRRTPFALCNKINDMVNEMLERGVIQKPLGQSDSGEDGSLRFCVDTKCSNKSRSISTSQNWWLLGFTFQI